MTASWCCNAKTERVTIRISRNQQHNDIFHITRNKYNNVSFHKVALAHTLHGSATTQLRWSDDSIPHTCTVCCVPSAGTVFFVSMFFFLLDVPHFLVWSWHAYTVWCCGTNFGCDPLYDRKFSGVKCPCPRRVHGAIFLFAKHAESIWCRITKSSIQLTSDHTEGKF